MQQMPPPSGNLFPDTPQQPSTRRFASNMPQLQPNAAPQRNLQHTGAVPVLNVTPYVTGQLQPLHGSQPVQQMPRMSTMPTAAAYQQQTSVSPLQQPVVPQPMAQAAPQTMPQPAAQAVQHGAPRQSAAARRARQSAEETELPVTALTGTPLMVYTVQGAPVAVNAEEMERALQEHEGKSGKKQKNRQQKEIRGKEKQKGKFAMKFSVAWCIFGVIGIISTVLLFLEWVAVPVLVLLHDLLAGGGV